jgi:enoyl-CoA hydratase/carnithine racemase
LGFAAPMDAGLAIEREAIMRVFASDDAGEGISAFTEKRKPQYTGR